MTAPRFLGAVEVVPDGDGWRPLRLLQGQRGLAPQPLAVLSSFTSGVRMPLRTGARTLAIEVTVDQLVMAHLDSPEHPAEFLAEVDGRVVARAVASPTGLIREHHDGPWTREPRPPQRLTLELGGNGDEREVVVWLPVDAAVSVVGVSGDATVAPAPLPAVSGPHWVHHGSSISQGGTARDARSTWPALVGRDLGIRWTNLGFGGNAQLDPMTAVSVRELDADVVTLEFGVNVVAADAMRQRAFASATHAFLDLIRDRMPHTPIVVMGAFACPALEDTPGPGRAGPDGRILGTPRIGDATALTLARSRGLLAEVVASRSDAALGYIDGRELFGLDDAHLLPDGIHPDQAGLDLIAARFLTAAHDAASDLGRAFAAAI